MSGETIVQQPHVHEKDQALFDRIDQTLYEYALSTTVKVESVIDDDLLAMENPELKRQHDIDDALDTLVSRSTRRRYNL